jgi:hypothetical protein
LLTDSTRILTDKGYLFPTEILETQGRLFLCPLNGNWIEGSVSRISKGDEYWTYKLSPLNNASEARTWSLNLARPHTVPLIDNSYTHDLRPKDLLPANPFDCGYDAAAWASGFMYRLDIQNLDSLDPYKYPLYKQKLDALKRTNQITRHSIIPKPTDPVTVKGSFIKGYLAAAGNPSRLETPDCDFFRFFVDNHGLAGLVLTGGERVFRKKLTTKEGVRFYNMNQITYCKGSDFKGFRVISVKGPSTSVVKLYQVYLDSTGPYVMEGGWTVLSA